MGSEAREGMVRAANSMIAEATVGALLASVFVTPDH
jgi:hypothetical protein